MLNLHRSFRGRTSIFCDYAGFPLEIDYFVDFPSAILHSEWEYERYSGLCSEEQWRKIGINDTVKEA